MMTQNETEPRASGQATSAFMIYDAADAEYAFPIDEFEESDAYDKKQLIISLLNTGCFDARPDLFEHAVVIATRSETADAFVNHFYRLYLNYLSGEGGDYVESHNIPSPYPPEMPARFQPIDYGVENKRPDELQQNLSQNLSQKLSQQQQFLAQNKEKIKNLVTNFR